MLWPQDMEGGSGERSLLATHRLVPGEEAMVASEKPQPLSQCEVPVKSPAVGRSQNSDSRERVLAFEDMPCAGKALLNLSEGNANKRKGNQCGMARKKDQFEILF